MSKVSLYDEASLKTLLTLQLEKNWGIDSINWARGVDLTKPLVPLDEEALFFPGATAEQRKAISQLMGLTIAACICEMEECLLRLRHQAWDSIKKQHPVGPEFEELGENFFIEEQKHSQVFRRYLKMYAQALHIADEELESFLPRIRGSRSEELLKAHLKLGGHAFWWIVAEVEQEFLFLHHTIRPHRDQIDPLYAEIHQKHFEEEMRHTPFPYLLLELLLERSKGPLGQFHVKSGLILSQVLQVFWAALSLKNMVNVNSIKSSAPLFEHLKSAVPLLKNQNFASLSWRFLTKAPYVSHLLNPLHHGKFMRFAERMGVPSVPFPEPEHVSLVDY